MKVAGRTLTVAELLADTNGPDDTIYVNVDGTLVPITESDNGVLSTEDELFDVCYQAERDLLEEIANDPKTWTKAKIMAAIAKLGI
jgi:sulfur carrier protein ThiS